MARQIRIEYAGAFYHVFSRGNQKQPIFFGDDDRNFFIGCLRRAHKKFGVVIHAYCLMPNHFHLILETPVGGLSMMMHFLITSYTIYFNKKHKRTGHLFQGRFKAILIEAACYAKELSRYVHLNPVRSGIVDLPERYPWSSYGYYLGVAVPERWLDYSVVLGLLGGQEEESRKDYVDFVIAGIGKAAPEALQDSLKKGILGSEEFVERIKRKHLGDQLAKSDREKPQLQRLRDKSDLPRLLSISERTLGPGNRWIVPVAILVSHRCTRLKLKDLGEFFSLSVSGVSSACARAREAVAANAALASSVQGIEQEVMDSGQGEGQTYFLRNNA